LEHSQALVGSGFAPSLELLGEVSEGVRGGHMLILTRMMLRKMERL
jgi:hypothetical protein